MAATCRVLGQSSPMSWRPQFPLFSPHLRSFFSALSTAYFSSPASLFLFSPILSLSPRFSLSLSLFPKKESVCVCVCVCVCVTMWEREKNCCVCVLFLFT